MAYSIKLDTIVVTIVIDQNAVANAQHFYTKVLRAQGTPEYEQLLAEYTRLVAVSTTEKGTPGTVDLSKVIAYYTYITQYGKITNLTQLVFEGGSTAIVDNDYNRIDSMINP